MRTCWSLVQYFRIPLLFLTVCFAVCGEKDPAEADGFHIPFTQHTLKNGLRVILSADRSSPTYAICVTYNVGSRDERGDEIGLAHLLEHMMFRGSARVAPGEHAALVRRAGGFLNATTSSDRTNFYETMPSSQLDLGLFLEADRMRALALTPGNLSKERNVVIEERRNRIDNRPYGSTEEAIQRAGYQTFAYGHSTIGTAADLELIDLQKAELFYKVHYVPNNAVLALVGDFDPAVALSHVQKYFESIPSKPLPPAPDLSNSFPDRSDVVSIEDPFTKESRADFVYRAPAGNTPEWYALAIAGDVLADGDASRLHKLLITQTGVATGVSATIQQKRAASACTFMLRARNSEDLQKAQQLLLKEIERLKTGPIEDWELLRVRREFVRTTSQRYESTANRAIVLSEFAILYDAPGLINTFSRKLSEPTQADIHAAVRRFWGEDQLKLVVTTPQRRTDLRNAGS